MGNRLQQEAKRLHEELPGIVRATLQDHGITDEVIDRHLLGFDGEHITVPVYTPDDTLAFLERWPGEAVGRPDLHLPRVELFNTRALDAEPERLCIAEGIHECLILESQDFSAVAASGTGRFFKAREWTPLLQDIPEIILAHRRGESRERRRHLPTRSAVIERARLALPQACRLHWPEEVGENGGAVAFFTTLGKTKQDFGDLLSETRKHPALINTCHA